MNDLLARPSWLIPYKPFTVSSQLLIETLTVFKKTVFKVEAKNVDKWLLLSYSSVFQEISVFLFTIYALE